MINRNSDGNDNTNRVLTVVFILILVVISFYFFNFHNGFSNKNEVWGTFGDYIGGVLNPIIAAIALYLIAKTYELQKTELEATRELLKESTSAQKNQIELAALTALLNANLMRISNLESKKSSIISRANGSGEFIRDIILTEAAPVNASITELFEDCENLQKQIKLFLTK